MSGRPKIPLYHYDTKENGYKYLGKFESQVEVFKMYFGGRKGRLFSSNPDYRRMVDGTFITKERQGRNLDRLIILHEDPNVIEREGDREIEIINSVGEVVGSCKNMRVLHTLTGRNYHTLNGMLSRNNKVCMSPSFGNFQYRYKNK